MNAERLQILRMVQEGKLTAEEAARLLEAVEAPAPPRPDAVRHLRIRVHERGNRNKTAEVKLPIGLVRTVGQFLGFGLVYHGPDGRRVEWADLEQAIQSGQAGRVIEVENETNRVEIYLE